MKSIMESIISSVIAEANSGEKVELDKRDIDLRYLVENRLRDLVAEISVAIPAWESMKEHCSYDEYLVLRRDAGTLTPLDLTRPKLARDDFSSDTGYNAHMARMSANMAEQIAYDGMKMCAECGKEKHPSKFRKNKGAVCTACKSRKYREKRETGDEA